MVGIAGPAITLCRSQGQGGVPLGMQAMKSEYLDPDLSDRSVSADILFREEPDEDEEEDENERDDQEEDDEESDEGYSE